MLGDAPSRAAHCSPSQTIRPLRDQLRTAVCHEPCQVLAGAVREDGVGACAALEAHKLEDGLAFMFELAGR